MLILQEEKLDYNDILIVPQRSNLDSRQKVNLLREYKFPHCKKNLYRTGIIASNMWNVGTKEMVYGLSEHDCLTALNKYIKGDDWRKLFCDPVVDGKFFFTVGESESDFQTLSQVYNYSLNVNRLMVCVDVANGYRSSFVDYIKRVRDFCCENVLVMAGNVTTPEMTQELILAGADIVKIGIGPGSVCETRVKTGVGYPMISSIIECSNVAHGLGGHICADGGCRTPGDVAKAFCAGADFVMLGGMLAGTDECQGEWTYRHYDRHSKKELTFSEYVNTHPADIDTVKYKLKFFGMSSSEAMKKFGGADKVYRASEGKSVYVDHKGFVSDVIEEILGGLRSCGTYIGADEIRKFPRCATFCKVRK